jgi:FimV-like protein
MIKQFFILLLFITPSVWATEVPSLNPAASAPALLVQGAPITQAPAAVAAPIATTPATVTVPVANNSESAIPAPGISQNDVMQKAQALEQAIPLIRQQVAETIQSVAQQEQKINDQIMQLQVQNAQLYDQINRISQQLNDAHQQLVREDHQEVQNSQKISLMKWAGFIFVISFLLISFILVWPSIKRAQKPKPIQHETVHDIIHEPILERTQDDEESEQEYDFMNSREAVPVKLDLARAYLDMGENDSAREVLQAVLEQGNEEQRAEAQELLASVKNS